MPEHTTCHNSQEYRIKRYKMAHMELRTRISQQELNDWFTSCRPSSLYATQKQIRFQMNATNCCTWPVTYERFLRLKIQGPSGFFGRKQPELENLVTHFNTTNNIFYQRYFIIHVCQFRQSRILAVASKKSSSYEYTEKSKQREMINL